MKKNAALYVRVSTDAQAEEGYSVDAQRQMLEAYCVSKEINDAVFYVDAGFSGSNTDRPELKRLIDDARRGTLSHCVVYKLDRLSRSQKDTLYLIEDVLNPNGVAFVSLKETIDTASPVGRLMIGILSAFAQLERENIRERTRMGMLERVKEGYWPGGGRPPFGYDYDAEKGVLIPNGDAKIVRDVYDLYLRGFPLYKIADIVGLKYERLAEQILNRRTNLGFIPYKGAEYIGKHPAIVDPDVFDRAMEIQTSKRRNSIRRPSEHLLSGLLFCGKCGAKMRYQKWGSDGHRLICYSRDGSKPSLIRDPDCKQTRLKASEVESAVTNALFDFKLEDGGDELDAETSALEMLKRRRDEAAKKLKRLYSLWADGGDDILKVSISNARKELSKAEHSLVSEEKLSAELKKNKRLVKELAGLKGVWDFMDSRERQTVTRSLIKRVTLTDEEASIEFAL